MKHLLTWFAFVKGEKDLEPVGLMKLVELPPICTCHLYIVTGGHGFRVREVYVREEYPFPIINLRAGYDGERNKKHRDDLLAGGWRPFEVRVLGKSSWGDPVYARAPKFEELPRG